VTHVGYRVTPGRRIRNPPSTYAGEVRHRDRHRAGASPGALRESLAALAGAPRPVPAAPRAASSASRLVRRDVRPPSSRTGDAARLARRSNVVASQVGFIAWAASCPSSRRQHIRDICGVVERARRGAGGRRVPTI
jgi:hypothetical protein